MRSSESKQQAIHLRLTFTSLINQYHMLIYRKLSTHILSHPRHPTVLEAFGKYFMSMKDTQCHSPSFNSMQRCWKHYGK